MAETKKDNNFTGVIKDKSDVESTNGGALNVTTSNVVDNRGNDNGFMKAAKISTFPDNFLKHYLRYPTVLFEGTITSSMNVGDNIYVSQVSPALFKSTSLSRISNFATNFRQWNGSMLIRFIFTKPIFVQTKVIAAYLPGATSDEIDRISISDLYGAQYHAVINPDNNSELSFSIPFVSGRNWLNMVESSGLFVVKLFQPLIASQPTGVSNVSVPFTLTLSSCDDSTDSYDETPLNFRFLVNPTYKNVELAKDLQEILYTSISPQIASATSNSQTSMVAVTQSNANVTRSYILFPLAMIEQWVPMRYRKDPSMFKYDNELNTAVASFDKTADTLYSKNMDVFDSPFKYVHFNDSYPTRGSLLYPSINATTVIDMYSYEYDSDGVSDTKFLYNSSLAPVPGVGTYDLLPGTLWVAPGAGFPVAFNSGTLVISAMPNGTYNYYYNFPALTNVPSFTDNLDFATAEQNIRYVTTSYDKSTYSNELESMSDAVIATRNRGGTHVLFCSRSKKTDLVNEINNKNYSNMTLCTNDIFSASFSKRAIQQSVLVDDSGQTRVNPVAIFFAIKFGVEVVAKASRFISDVLTAVTPLFSANGARVGPNTAIIFDVTVPSKPLSFIKDISSRELEELPDISDPDISVVNVF